MVDSQNNISNNSRVKLLHFQLDTGDTVAVLDPTIPPPVSKQVYNNKYL